MPTLSRSAPLATSGNAGIVPASPGSLLKYLRGGATPDWAVPSGNLGINVMDFGAVGDNATDDGPAIANAIASAVSPRSSVYFPAGIYRVITPIPKLVNLPVLRLAGAGDFQSRIVAGASMTAIFDTTDSSIYDSFEFQDIQLNGAGLAQYGIRCEQFIHGMIRRVQVINTTVSAIRLNNGYNNVIERCVLTLNANGIDWTGAANNNGVIRGNLIYSNTGIGVLLGNSLGMTIEDNGIESNRKGGIVAFNMKGLMVTGGYFERNGQDGIAFTVPETLTVKADIYLLSANATTLSNALATGVDGCMINGNSFTSFGTGGAGSIDATIFAAGWNNLQVGFNNLFDTSKETFFVGFWNGNGTVVANMRTQQVFGNTTDSIGFLGAGTASFAVTTPNVHAATAAPTSGTYVAGDRVLNSAPAVGQPKGWTCTVGGSPGTFVSEGNL